MTGPADSILPDRNRLFSVLEATWPPARHWDDGCWVLREGRGGGKRVSAASARGSDAPTHVPQAERAMRALGQRPLFMIREGDENLDQELAARGYRRIDATIGYACPVAALTAPRPDRLSGFPVWEPLHIMREIWATGGIGADRLAVMERAHGPKTGLLARAEGRAAGTAFVAIHESCAMLHALEVLPQFRRKGVGTKILRNAAIWAQNQGAETFTLLTTSGNAPSNALYTSLNMSIVGHYHYRAGE